MRIGNMLILLALLTIACGSAGNNGNGDPEAPTTDSGAASVSTDEAATVSEPASGGACQADEDCVKATCCHASACVDKSRAPACDGMMCTMDCVPGTMDCGQGSCVCRDGQCAAEIKSASLDASSGPE